MVQSVRLLKLHLLAHKRHQPKVVQLRFLGVPAGAFEKDVLQLQVPVDDLHA